MHVSMQIFLLNSIHYFLWDTLYNPIFLWDTLYSKTCSRYSVHTFVDWVLAPPERDVKKSCFLAFFLSNLSKGEGSTHEIAAYIVVLIFLPLFAKLF